MRKFIKVEKTDETEWSVFLELEGLHKIVARFYDKTMLNIFLETLGVEEIK